MSSKTNCYYCDHCGEEVYSIDDVGKAHQTRPYVPYQHVPFDVVSANKGESAVVCRECIGVLTTPGVSHEAPSAPLAAYVQ